ncbi:MAG: FG-GAP repeat protein [Chitinophagales bacterium]
MLGPGDPFGFAISMSETTAFIGCYTCDGNVGAAYVYDFNGTTWSLSQKLTDGAAVSGDWFGNSVDIFGDRAIIGSLQ